MSSERVSGSNVGPEQFGEMNLWWMGPEILVTGVVGCLQGCCVWSLHESCPCLWTCCGGQLLGLPLDLLAGPIPGQCICRTACQVGMWQRSGIKWQIPECLWIEGLLTRVGEGKLKPSLETNTVVLGLAASEKNQSQHSVWHIGVSHNLKAHRWNGLR